jgi:hypothetical protein
LSIEIGRAVLGCDWRAASARHRFGAAPDINSQVYEWTRVSLPRDRFPGVVRVLTGLDATVPIGYK